MKVYFFGVMICAMAGSLVPASSSLAQSSEAALVDSSTNVLNEFMAIPNQGIPRSLVAKAQGLVIIPGMFKVGAIIGGRHGRGIVVIRDEQGAWRPPTFVTMTGGSVGPQVGISSTDEVLVFRTRKSVEGLLNGKFTIGVDAAVAAGPVGRQAAAATDGKLKAEILSYSRSRGGFLGASLDGSVLQVNAASNQTYYRSAGLMSDGTPYALNAQLPPSASRLLAQLAAYSLAPVSAPGGPAATGTLATNSTMPGAASPSAAQFGSTVPVTGTGANPGAASAYNLGGGYGGTGAVGSSIYGSNPAQPSVVPPAHTSVTGVTNNSALQLPAAQQAEATRKQLVTVSQQLGALLDEQWRAYLGLPTAVFSGTNHPPANVLDQPIARCDRVSADPRYAVLYGRSEFQQFRELLRTYQRQLQAATAAAASVPPSSTPVSNRSGAGVTYR